MVSNSNLNKTIKEQCQLFNNGLPKILQQARPSLLSIVKAFCVSPQTPGEFVAGDFRRGTGGARWTRVT